MSTEIWLEVGQWTVPPILSAIIEYKFGIIGKIKKAWYWVLNKNAGFEIGLSLSKTNEFEKIKTKLIEEARRRFGSAPQKKNNATKLELQTDTYLTTLNYLQNKEIYISTTKVEAGIRDLKSKASTFLGMVNKLKKDTGLHSTEASLKIFMPFKWTYVNIRTPRNLKLTDYDIKFNDSQFNSVINLKMNNLSINGEENSLNYVLDSFTGMF
ncbi:hypothetical protein KW805_02180 [Candidatus Pacearchaeota archaeon]|nr:hypothetical protein [Candidatus Pacearchaeota archaeon]